MLRRLLIIKTKAVKECQEIENKKLQDVSSSSENITDMFTNKSEKNKGYAVPAINMSLLDEVSLKDDDSEDTDQGTDSSFSDSSRADFGGDIKEPEVIKPEKQFSKSLLIPSEQQVDADSPAGKFLNRLKT